MTDARPRPRAEAGSADISLSCTPMTTHRARRRSVASRLGRLLVAAAGVAALAGCSGETPPAQPGGATGGTEPIGLQYPGLTLTVGVLEGSRAGEIVTAAAEEWQARTGARVAVESFPNEPDGAAMVAALSNPASCPDIVIYPSMFSGVVMGGGKVRTLGPLQMKEIEGSDASWSDFFPFCRDFLVRWDGKTYAYPVDGDTAILYFRRDLLYNNEEIEKKFKQKFDHKMKFPRQWRSYAEMAELFTGWDWNDDGAPDFGAAEARAGDEQPSVPFLIRAAAKANNETSQSFLLDQETLKPRLLEPPFVEALEQCVELQAFGPEGMAEFGRAEARKAFLEGRTAMLIDWTDFGPITVREGAEGIKEHFGYSLSPGAQRLYDAHNDTWKDYEAVYYSPYVSSRSLVASVATLSTNEAAAFDFLSHFTSPDRSLANVQAEGSPFTLHRVFHASKVSTWVDLGFPGEKAREYLGVTQASLRHHRAAPGLRIPGSHRYMAALDAELRRVYRGAIPPKEALGRVSAEWEKITEELGREQQLRAYQAAIGVVFE